MEIQKLAYFLQDAGVDLRLPFAKGPYGPYADDLRKSLREMEGHYISGYCDGISRPLDIEPIEVTARGRAGMEESLASAPDVQARVRRVLDLVCGFESAYGLELLASVHWAATQTHADTPTAVGDVVRGWTRRKGTMFTQPHVDAAWEALVSGAWLRRAAVGV